MTCECPHHITPCEQEATRETYDRDPLYVCEDCCGGEDESRPLTEDECKTAC